MQCVLSIDTVEGAEAVVEGYMQCVLTLWRARDGTVHAVRNR